MIIILRKIRQRRKIIWENKKVCKNWKEKRKKRKGEGHIFEEEEEMGEKNLNNRFYCAIWVIVIGT